MKTIVSLIALGVVAASGYLSWRSEPRITKISNDSKTKIAATQSTLPTTNAESISGLGKSWKVIPRSIHDGDTLRATQGGSELKVRFCGIDSPELKQKGGEQARDYLRNLLSKSNYTVYLKPIETDRYGRTVAEVFRSDGNQAVNVNAEMTQAGWAYYYAQYARNCPDREQIERGEQLAKEKGIGVWSDPRAMRPWDWRRANR